MNFVAILFPILPTNMPNAIFQNLLFFIKIQFLKLILNSYKLLLCTAQIVFFNIKP